MINLCLVIPVPHGKKSGKRGQSLKSLGLLFGHRASLDNYQTPALFWIWTNLADKSPLASLRQTIVVRGVFKHKVPLGLLINWLLGFVNNKHTVAFLTFVSVSN